MLLDLKVIDVLQKMGLTLYGAKVYAALVSTGPANATMLASRGGSPPDQNIPGVEKARGRKWVMVEKGRPNITPPATPGKFSTRKNHRFLPIETCEPADHDLRSPDAKRNPKVWLIRGADNITTKAIEMISRARQSVMMLGTLYSPVEIEQLTREITRVKKKGVSVRIITRPKIRFRNGEIDIIDALRPVTADIRVAGPPFLKYTLIDDREMLMTFARVEENMPDPESFIAIWIPNASVTHTT